MMLYYNKYNTMQYNIYIILLMNSPGTRRAAPGTGNSPGRPSPAAGRRRRSRGHRTCAYIYIYNDLMKLRAHDLAEGVADPPRGSW